MIDNVVRAKQETASAEVMGLMSNEVQGRMASTAWSIVWRDQDKLGGRETR